MNRTEARQLDCEIRECLENFSIEQGLNPKFGELIMDNYLEIIPDDSKREMIFLGKESSSYKMGNIQVITKHSALSCSKILIQYFTICSILSSFNNETFIILPPIYTF